MKRMFKASRRRFGTAEAARRCGPRRQKRRPSEPPRGRQKESGAKFSESTSEMQRDARVHCTPLKILHPAAYMRRYMKCDCVWTPPFSASSPKVGRSLCVELRFFGLFCKNLLHVILTPPGRYQHPHDTSNPPVGRWGNCEPKWWPQGSSFCLLKNNIANTQGKKR